MWLLVVALLAQGSSPTSVAIQVTVTRRCRVTATSDAVHAACRPRRGEQPPPLIVSNVTSMRSSSTRMVTVHF